MSNVPKLGLRRIRDLLAPNGPIPVSKSTWYAGVKSGRFPAPVHLGGKISAWRQEDIDKLIEIGAGDARSSRVKSIKL